VKSFFSESKKNNQIEYMIGDAIEIIPKLECEFDMVFIDADKRNYINYFEMVLPRLKSNGIIIADNVLWSGKVIDTDKIRNDRLTKNMHDFNEFIKNDGRISKIILPIRDGITLIKKK
jgi:caffeoyl-CoA O-methyltransferase